MVASTLESLGNILNLFSACLGCLLIGIFGVFGVGRPGIEGGDQPLQPLDQKRQLIEADYRRSLAAISGNLFYFFAWLSVLYAARLIVAPRGAAIAEAAFSAAGDMAFLFLLFAAAHALRGTRRTSGTRIVALNPLVLGIVGLCVFEGAVVIIDLQVFGNDGSLQLQRAFSLGFSVFCAVLCALCLFLRLGNKSAAVVFLTYAVAQPLAYTAELHLLRADAVAIEVSAAELDRSFQFPSHPTVGDDLKRHVVNADVRASLAACMVSPAVIHERRRSGLAVVDGAAVQREVDRLMIEVSKFQCTRLCTHLDAQEAHVVGATYVITWERAPVAGLADFLVSCGKLWSCAGRTNAKKLFLGMCGHVYVFMALAALKLLLAAALIQQLQHYPRTYFNFFGLVDEVAALPPEHRKTMFEGSVMEHPKLLTALMAVVRTALMLIISAVAYAHGSSPWLALLGGVAWVDKVLGLIPLPSSRKPASG